jgi:hypothetical protein
MYTQPRIIDADRDGDLDVALYLRADGRSGTLQLALRNEGSFTISSFPMPEADAAYSFDLGDIDGDGIPDAITANHGMNAPQTIFVSYGGTQFSTFDSYPVPFSGATGVFGPGKRGLIHVYARDLDKDGRIDIAASTAPFNTFAARILINKPAGMVARNVSGAATIDITVADATNDGLVDLVVNGNQTPNLRTYRGGAFSSFTSLNTTADPRTPVVGDITGDGIRDIIAAPTFGKTITVVVGGSGGGATNVITPELSAADFMSNSYVQELSLGDVDNDGDLDVIFATDRVIWLRYGAADSKAPALSLPADLIVEATSAAGAAVTFGATASDETDGNVAVQCAPASGSLFVIGSTTVTCHARDAAGNSASGSFNVTVRDTTAPAIVSITPSINLITPPNHKMVPVTIAVVATDATDTAPVSMVTGVSSSEGLNDRGDGNTNADWAITGPLSVALRAERTGKGNGRVYTITVRTVDRFGNATIATTSVSVR